MNYTVFLAIIALSMIAIYYSYKKVDGKNKEPKRAILFTAGFSICIFVIEYFLIKPSVGKLLAFYDTHMFVYFLTEERDHLSSFSSLQKGVILLLSCASKAITFSIGLKVLFTYLYRLGKARWFAGGHTTSYGFLDEPVDYVVYALVYFIVLALSDNAVRFRFDSVFTTDNVFAVFTVISYMIIAIVLSSTWLKRKVKFTANTRSVITFTPFPNNLINKRTRGIYRLISGIELWNALLLFLMLIFVKIPLFINSMSLQLGFFLISIILLATVLKTIRMVSSKKYTIIEEL